MAIAVEPAVVAESTIKRILDRVGRIPPSYFVFLLLLIVLGLKNPQLIRPNILATFIRQVAPLGIVVLGQLLVMRVNSIDLSSAGVILLVNYTISSGRFDDDSLLLPILVSISIGLIVGLLNGVLIGKRRSSAVLVTLAVGTVLVGFVEYLSSGTPPGDVPGVFNSIYDAKLAIFPAPVIFWVLMTVAFALFLSRFVFGRYIESVGENPLAAHFSGVPVARTVVIAHVIAGLMAGVAGLVQTASLAVGSIRFGGDIPVEAVAATILGGVTFGRGDGGVWGPFFGVLSFGLLFVVMTSFGVPDPGKLVARGLIILFAAILYGVRTTDS